ncbi:MAG: radical SAM protein [Deltaproteobacteria bacterium]|nr:radical SAM protein [Deltaproteobacteria bacterium]
MSALIWKKLLMTAKIWGRSMIQANVMVNYDCDCRCRICDYWREPYAARPRMTREVGLVLAAKLKNVAPLALCLVGGEPLLNPDLLDIAGPLAKAHFLDLVTNGRLVTRETARDLFRAGFSEIGVSLDYANAREHDAQRGLEGLFDKAAAALENLMSARLRPAQRVRLTTVVMEDNLDHIEPLSVLAGRLGVKHNLTLCVCGRGQARGPADLERTVARIKEIQSRRPELLILPGFLEGFAGRGRENCKNGLNLAAFDSEGRILRCLDRQEEPAGSVMDESVDVLFKKLREKSDLDPCDECWTSCRGIVEPLLYGPSRLKNIFYYMRATKAEPLAGDRRPDEILERGAVE